jgi:rod shape determining protein RodA
MIYAISMLPLLAVFVLGTGKYGRQWLDLGCSTCSRPSC